jgi:phosphatidate phosphatase APP1
MHKIKRKKPKTNQTHCQVPKSNRKIIEAKLINMYITADFPGLVSWYRHFSKEWQGYTIFIGSNLTQLK